MLRTQFKTLKTEMEERERSQVSQVFDIFGTWNAPPRGSSTVVKAEFRPSRVTVQSVQGLPGKLRSAFYGGLGGSWKMLFKHKYHCPWIFQFPKRDFDTPIV